MNKRLRKSSRTAFTVAKNDVEVTWRYVHYPPSRSVVIQTLKDNFKLAETLRSQREREFSGFGSFNKRTITPKFIKNRELKKVPNTNSDDNMGSDDDLSKDKSSISQESKDNTKSKEMKRKSTMIKRVSSATSKAESTRISISNLAFLFQQNKPQHFFGIRKPKTFELQLEKDAKLDTIKPYPSIESIYEFFVKHKSDSTVKETLVRPTSNLQTLSLKYTSITVSEILDRFTAFSKSEQRQSVNNDILDVLKSIANEALINKERMLRISCFSSISFPDIDDRLSRERILFLYVYKYYRENHPRYKDKIKNEVEETEFEKIIMKNCLLNNKLILRIMKSPKFYPMKLRQKMAEIDMKLTSTFDEGFEKIANFVPNLKFEPKLMKPKSSIYRRKINALDEIGCDCKEFEGFYRPLFEYWINNVVDTNDSAGEIEPENVKEVVQSLPVIIAAKRNQPGTKIMILTQQLIKCGLTNTALLNELCNGVEGWLDQILKSFLSKFSTVRLECFITICYLLSKPSYISGINSNLFNETFYDIIATILRCIDLKSEEFPLLYSLLGVIFHYAPSQIILDCLIERAPYSTEVEMISKWPKFVYIAMKYWPSQYFNSSPIYLRRVIETLENHYLRESLCRKNIKDAITCIVKRFNVPSNMITVWPKTTEQFPD